jgi:hypothetical protein
MINADAVSLEAIGVNPLDPGARAPAARAARDQGCRLADNPDHRQRGMPATNGSEGAS